MSQTECTHNGDEEKLSYSKVFAMRLPAPFPSFASVQIEDGRCKEGKTTAQ
jgi:hypothetical protein